MYDTTRFVKVSIREVAKTLLEAMALVFVVVFVFLQSWRATLIPFAAVPVSLLGTFAGLFVLGYSINTLTLFGMVLSIGIVVDDAIVVLENVERIMREEHKPAREAAIQAMQEVTGPVIAIALTLCAVFVPIAFLGGLTGELYRQFSVTISIAVVISAIVALTLTPTLSALMLKHGHRPPGRFFRWFNNWFSRVTGRYADGVGFVLRRGSIAMVLFAGMVALTLFLWRTTPSSLVPDEDQGYYIGAVFLPDGATLQRTDKVVTEVQQAMLSNPANQYSVAFTGMDFLGGGFRNSAATIFASQKHWDDRPGVYTHELVGEFFMKTAHIKEALVLAFAPPPIFGLGNAGGFEFYIQNRGEGGAQRLAQVMGQFLARANQDPMLGGGGGYVQTLWRPNVPQLRVDVDREKAKALGVPIDQLYNALAATLGHLLRQRLQQVRPHLAGADVGRAELPQQPGGHRRYLRPLREGRDDPAQVARFGALRLGARLARSLQQSPCGEAAGPGRAGSILGSGDPGCGAGRQGSAASRFQFRLGRRVVPGEALGRHVGPRAGAGSGDGVPDPRRAVREMVAAAVRASGAAVRDLRRDSLPFG